MPKPPPEPPPDPPEVKTIQIHCVPWTSMDFRVEVQLPYLSIAELEEIIKARHGEAIDNLALYKEGPQDPINKLTAGSEDRMDKVGCTVYYDYYPPIDPFENRPTAHGVYSTNPLVKLTCAEEYEGTVIKGVTYFSPDGFWKNTTKCEARPALIAWSKTAADDPYTAKMKAAEAAAEAARVAAEEAEAARIAAEEAARKQAIIDERIAKKKAKKDEEKRIKAELAAEEAERARIEAEKEAERLAEEAAARGEEPPPEKPAFEFSGPIPDRVKGATVPIFLGPTSKQHYGLDECNKANPWKCVHKDTVLAEIKDKGKISDMYIFKKQFEDYKGEDGEVLFCLDRDEVYSDEGMVVCFHEAEKINFQIAISKGEPLPPPL
mmetsp:Transcript_31441/g.82137  ORF Transcript_31441/g.82137 Transcript_31441/m.82137 type:complete len:378 (+) Transcript_31441:101-1234(+)|eukprot:CAMPEP_0115880302 /NCGR_PEP_ID=MMETSP0287-20121206/27796_1 /TAXON_ID=412157 /ORGANISM="Chrysochromulina rotalis, Strain UIO044" /LENGTH=377 /DNA_ID=CAMNT_0003336099 /DNA_START=93 /DNA_END=1226 /DNA_ORIENTATION=-